ncbi:ATP-binding protein [Nostoc piscinale]|uniref:ATP-binding protein n=1 Tax=Nostoc piscinale TaxID=224012 RepID=UPI000A8D4E5E|nr:ATP-binding protein [Nostoc piscinale]
MSNFNFDKLTDDEWAAIAQEQADDTGSQLMVVGGVVAGLAVAAATAIPPAGLLVTGWLWYEAWKRTADANRQDEAIDAGLIAHVLKKERLQHFSQQYGTEVAAAQIERAIDLGLPVSPDAEDLLDNAPIVAAPALPASASTEWVQNLVKQTALIWGNQGGGKSWLCRHVVKLKKEAGYRVIVCDPDSNRSEWQGVESYHAWEDIEAQIRFYVEELERRLAEFNNSNKSEDEWRAGLQPIALIIEEATTYCDFIEDKKLLEKFGKLALTKSRKQEMPLTVIAHNNTQSCLFGIKGLYNLVIKMLQVQCLAEVDKTTLQPRSTGQALVKLDSSNEWIPVALPKIESKITQF